MKIATKKPLDGLKTCVYIYLQFDDSSVLYDGQWRGGPCPIKADGYSLRPQISFKLFSFLFFFFLAVNSFKFDTAFFVIPDAFLSLNRRQFGRPAPCRTAPTPQAPPMAEGNLVIPAYQSPLATTSAFLFQLRHNRVPFFPFAAHNIPFRCTQHK